MKTGKIGAIFLISILALAGIGAGYASWTDTITIDGEVNTGSVGWHFVGVSGTWVWKVWGLNAPIDEIYIDHTGGTDWQVDFPDCEFERIAFSEAVIDDDDNQHATVTFDNLFPCIEFMADVMIKYTGTVPGKISGITFTDPWGDTNDESLITDYITTKITIFDENEDIVVDECPIQLHLGWTIHVVIIIHLEQIDDLMGLTGSFDMDVEVKQWNKVAP